MESGRKNWVEISAKAMHIYWERHEITFLHSALFSDILKKGLVTSMVP